MNINTKIIELLKNRNLTITTVESITGGKIISSLIEVPGASQVISQAYIVYSNESKINTIGIDGKLIEAFGVVSTEVAIALARKTKELTKADIVISTTGEAGPIPNDESIGVGTVCFAMIIDKKEFIFKRVFAGNRLGIINNAVTYILNDLFYRIS